MNWEETIIHARKADEYRQLIVDAYLDENLKKNVEAFRNSGEFKETLKLIGKYIKPAPGQKLRLLDIGAGNGISTLAFALEGFSVVAVEPDPSATVGARAIQFLKEEYRLPDVEIDSAYGEALTYADSSFDVVYARQAMHHAHDLNGFIAEAARVAKPKGIVLTCRDHVVNDTQQKEEFLKAHPFQKFYHGENAFSTEEYKAAFSKAGLTLVEELGHLDSMINYSPQTKQEITADFKKALRRKIPLKLDGVAYLDNFIFNLFKWKTNNLHNFAGRLYTFVARKP
jgi:SAM-dependent methyltransferase